MKHAWRALIVTVSVWGCIWPGTIDRAAGADRAVRQLTIAELNQIVQQPGNRCVLVVMAAWCAPCIKELPDLIAINKKYAQAGLNLIGLSIDYSGPAAMRPVLNRYRVNFPVYWVGEQAIEAYNIRKIPLMMLVKDGVITQRLVGMRSRKKLETAIVEFIKP